MPGFRGAYRRHHGDRYGPTYQADRRRLFAALPDVFICCRCHKPADKHAKEKPDRRGVIKSAIHLDHDEHGGYLGFAHNNCNRDAGAAKGGRVRAARHGPWRGQRRQPPSLPSW